MAERVTSNASTGRLVKVSPPEKRAAQLRIKLDQRRGQATPQVIKSVAAAKRTG